jgi:FtsP/CotA-like multicopper oxidase with cupredoxin domain
VSHRTSVLAVTVFVCVMAASGTARQGPGTPGPGGIPDYLGIYPNWALSPLPAGSLLAVEIEEGGSGYTSPLVTIDDAYRAGTGAEAVAIVTAGVITGVILNNAGSGYQAPMVIITDPTGAGAVARALLNPATLTGGIRKFVDRLPGLTPAAANDLGQYIPVAIPDQATYPGSDYYEIELGEYSEKLHTDLRPTKLRGYRQVNGPEGAAAPFHYLGPLIRAERNRPVRVLFVNKLPTGAQGSLFLPVDKTVPGAGTGPNGGSYSENRGGLHLNGGVVPWISDGTAHQWITPAGEATDYPEGVSVFNVPDMPNPGRPVDGCVPGSATPCNPRGSGSQTFYYANQQSARLLFFHDRSAGISRLNVYAGESGLYLINDPVEQALVHGGTVGGRPFTAGTIPADEIPLVIQDRTFVDPDTLPSQDPTWAGPRESGSLWFPHVYMPIQNPAALDGVNPMGRWLYGPFFWPVFNAQIGPVANPYDPDCDSVLDCPVPGTPNPSIVPDAFMDTPVVNGTAYPYLEVQPKAYRFRILNASNDRTWNLQLYKADTTVGPGCPGCTQNSEVKMVPFNRTLVPNLPDAWGTEDVREGGVPDPAHVGPPWIQIGSDGGLLPAPVVLPAQPVNYVWDKASSTFANIKEHSLLLAPAERADAIVDFSAFAGQTLILYNDAPAPVPRGEALVDYYTGKEDHSRGGRGSGGSPTTYPGFGPNTRTIMQIRVAPGTAAPFDRAKLDAAFATSALGPGAFAASQDPIIVPQAAYNSAYKASFADPFARIFDTALSFTPLGQASSRTFGFMHKSISEEFDFRYARQWATLGIELPFPYPTLTLASVDPPTELLTATDPSTPIGAAEDGTQLWRITHNGVLTHAIDFPFPVQIVNRVGWDNSVEPPEANERGWKTTVRMNPLSDIVIAVRPTTLTLPFELPNNVRLLAPAFPPGAAPPGTGPFTSMDPSGNPAVVSNEVTNFGWEYAWNAAGFGSEVHDMARPFVVAAPPGTPFQFMVTPSPTSAALTWSAGASLARTSFLVQKAGADCNFSTPLASWPLLVEPALVDETFRVAACYRVAAVNTVGGVPSSYPALTLSRWSPSVLALSPLRFSPNALAFPAQLVGTRSAAAVTSLTNYGGKALRVAPIVLAGDHPADFLLKHTCPDDLPSDQSCDVTVAFRPTKMGDRRASVNVNGESAVLPLSGRGVSPVLSLSSTSLTFSSALRVTTKAKSVTVSNTGTAPMKILSILLGGLNANQFAITRTTTCPGTLAAGSSCTVSVTFTPTLLFPATKTAELQVNVSPPAVSATVSLTGRVK